MSTEEKQHTIPSEEEMFEAFGLKWKNPPTVADLKEDKDAAIAAHSTVMSDINKWLTALNPVKQKRKKKNRSTVVPPVVRTQIEWRVSELEMPFLNGRDMFRLSPATFADKDAAMHNEMVINKQFRTDIPRNDFISKYIRMAVHTGTTIVKVAWKTEKRDVRQLVEIEHVLSDPAEIQAYLQSEVQLGHITPEIAEQTMLSGQPIRTLKEETRTVTSTIFNAPVLEVKDPRNIILDPSAQSFRDARFLIDVYETDLATLKANTEGIYKNLDYIDVDAQQYTDYVGSIEQTTFRFKDNARKKFVVYEYWGYWDVFGKGTVEPIVAAFVGDVMIRLSINPFPDKQLPYVVVPYLPKPQQPDVTVPSLYGEPDAALLMESQDIIGVLTRATLDIVGKTANAQMAVPKNFTDEVNTKKYYAGDDFEYSINNGVNPKDAIRMLTPADIPSSLFNLLDRERRQVDSLAGYTQFSNGISGNSLGNSVGGIQAVTDATHKRALSIIRRLAEGIETIGKKIIAMNSVWLTDEEIVRITDETEHNIKRDDLAGNFDLNLAISTPEDDQKKANDLNFLLQTTMQAFPLDMSKMLIAATAKLFNLPDVEKAINEYQIPGPDPIQQQIAQLDVQERQMRIALLGAQAKGEQVKAQENMADINYKNAKTANEYGKARKINSEADNLDYDYLDRVAGTQQERELEKIYAQEAAKRDAKVDVDNNAAANQTLFTSGNGE